MSESKYFCSHCDQSFIPVEGEALRCPSCLRKHGLVEVVEVAEEGGKKRRLTSVIIVVLIAAGVWAVSAISGGDSAGTETQNETTAPSSETNSPSSEGLEILSGAWRDRTDVLVDLPVEAKAVKADLASVVTAVQGLRKAGLIPARRLQPYDSRRMPRSAQVYLPAFSGKEVPSLGSFEWASLVGGLSKALGVKGIHYGYDKSKGHGRTTLEERSYVVGVGKSYWDFDGQAVAAKNVVAFSPVQTMANVLAWRSLGEVADADKAVKAAGFAKRLGAADPAILFVVGRIQIATGMEEVGFSSLEQVASKHGDAMTYFMLGELSLQAQRHVSAQQQLVKATQLDPGFAEPHILLAQLTLSRREVTPAEGQAALIKQVEGHLDGAEKADAKVFGLRILKSKLARLAGKDDDELRLLKEAFQHHPSRAPAVLSLVDYHLEKKNTSEAKAVLETGLKQGNPDPGIRLKLANLLMMEGDVDAGTLQLEAALKADGDDPQIRLILAQVYVRQNMLEKGQKTLEEQLKFFPDDPKAYLLLAQLAMTDKNWARATTLLDNVTKKEPNNGEAHVTRYLMVLLKGDDPTTARKAASKAIGGPLRLAQLMLEQLQFEEAAHLLDAEMKANPKDDQAAILRTMLYVVSGKKAQASLLVEARVKAAGKEKGPVLRKRFEEAMTGGQEMRDALLASGRLSKESETTPSKATK
jgi:Tfp pilus assembly protein PilF